MSRRSVCLLTLMLISGAILGALLWFNPFADSRFSRVEDRLYIGEAVSIPPPGTQAVVNVCSQKDAYLLEHSLWEPLDGVHAPDLAWLQRVVGYIDTQRQAGRTTYVHCWAGQNRSAMVVAAYLMHEHGWTRDRTLTFLRSNRPQVDPNAAHMDLLARWEVELRKRRARSLDSDVNKC